MVFDLKDPEFLTEDLQEIKKLISFSLGVDSDIKLKGSANIKSQLNYADLDFFTIIKIKNQNNDFNRFRLNLLSNIDTLINKYDSIITDIKFGINQYKYFEDKTKYKGKDKIIKIQYFIMNNKYYTEEEKKDLSLLYNNINFDDILSVDDYLDYYRKCYTLRWGLDEIKKGYITLYKQEKKLFIDCFTDPAMFKIDLLSQLRNGINEISNIIFFEYKDKILNKPIEVDEDDSVKSDFTYYWKAESYYKALKRLFVISNAKNQIELGNVLTELFNSPLGILYKLSSMLKNIEEFNIKLKKENIIHEIDLIKSKINNVWGLENPFFYTITNKLNTLKRTPQNIDKMKMIMEQIEDIINTTAREYVDEKKLNEYVDRNILNVNDYINNFF